MMILDQKILEPSPKLTLINHPLKWQLPMTLKIAFPK